MAEIIDKDEIKKKDEIKNDETEKIDWPALEEYWTKEYEEDYIPKK